MSYEAFIADCLKVCQCCGNCWNRPCDGVMAGAFCDRMCHCPAEDEPCQQDEDTDGLD
jgi:hypothetical protein